MSASRLKSTWMLAILWLGCTAEDVPEDANEGDDAGECADGADNNRDGKFDCADPGCAGSPDCDTDVEVDVDTDTDVDSDTDTDSGIDTDTDPSVPFTIGVDGAEGVVRDCTDVSCTYRITTSRPAGRLSVDITVTGWSYLYNETHTAFALESVHEDGSETYALTLDAVNDLDGVVIDHTTLIHPRAPDDAYDNATWYFLAIAATGDSSDCRVTGENIDFYQEWCTTPVVYAFAP